MPGLARTSRISLRATRLDPTFAAAALFIFGGTTAAPSSLAAAFDNTINCVSLSFAIFSSFACDGVRRHERDPAKAQRPALLEGGTFRFEICGLVHLRRNDCGAVF